MRTARVVRLLVCCLLPAGCAPLSVAPQRSAAVEVRPADPSRCLLPSTSPARAVHTPVEVTSIVVLPAAGGVTVRVDLNGRRDSGFMRTPLTLLLRRGGYPAARGSLPSTGPFDGAVGLGVLLDSRGLGSITQPISLRTCDGRPFRPASAVAYTATVTFDVLNGQAGFVQEVRRTASVTLGTPVATRARGQDGAVVRSLAASPIGGSGGGGLPRKGPAGRLCECPSRSSGRRVPRPGGR